MSKMKDTIKDQVRDDYKEHHFHDKPLGSCSSCFKRFSHGPMSPNDWDAYEAWVERQADLEELARDNFYDR